MNELLVAGYRLRGQPVGRRVYIWMVLQHDREVQP
jgi:hypothetical protein